MQVVFVLGLGFALSKSDATAQQGITRIGFQDDMTFIGSAAALNRSWSVIEGTLPVRATDFAGTNAEFGRLGVSSFRTRTCRQRFATCVGRSHARGTVSVFLDLRQSCNIATAHTNDRGLRKPWRHCRASRGLLAINMTTSASQRRGCSWARASRTPWIMISGWSHRR